MVHAVHKALGKETIAVGINIHLQRQHIGGRKLLARFQHAINSGCSPRRLPSHAEGVWIAIGSDAAVGGCNDARGWIVDTWQFVKRNVADPLM